MQAPRAVGPFASFADIGSGTGSSPALIRAMMSAARRRASSGEITPSGPIVHPKARLAKAMPIEPGVTYVFDLAYL